MLLSGRFSEHRSLITFIVLVALCVASLTFGARATFLADGLRSALLVAAYPFLKVFSLVQSGADYLAGLVVYYDATQEENEQLRRKCAQLRSQIVERAERAAENEQLRRMLDFERAEARLHLEPVEAIGRSEGTRQIIIERGSRYGVRPGMCVMTEDGVIGQVSEVDPFTSNVNTLHNAKFSAGAMIRRNRVRGIVRGTGSDLSRICLMQYIDIKDDVSAGDEVVTSPESIFPGGYPIGRVTAVHQESGSLFKTAEVQPAADPYSVDTLFLVWQEQPEAGELAASATERVAALAYPMPDTRSIQERYAP